MQACIAFVSAMQAVLGVLLPICMSARRESAAQLEFARRRGIPRSERRYRAARLVHSVTHWR